MIWLQTPSFTLSFQDGRQLASKPVPHKQRVARSSPIFRSVYTQSYIKTTGNVRWYTAWIL